MSHLTEDRNRMFDRLDRAHNTRTNSYSCTNTSPVTLPPLNVSGIFVTHVCIFPKPNRVEVLTEEDMLIDPQI